MAWEARQLFMRVGSPAIAAYNQLYLAAAHVKGVDLYIHPEALEAARAYDRLYNVHGKVHTQVERGARGQAGKGWGGWVVVWEVRR